MKMHLTFGTTVMCGRRSAQATMVPSKVSCAYCRRYIDSAYTYVCRDLLRHIVAAPASAERSEAMSEVRDILLAEARAHADYARRRVEALERALADPEKCRPDDVDTIVDVKLPHEQAGFIDGVQAVRDAAQSVPDAHLATALLDFVAYLDERVVDLSPEAPAD